MAKAKAPAKRKLNKCHQCQEKKEGVARCTNSGCDKQYCLECIGNWYSLLSKEEIEKICPYCRKNCNCKACLHSDELYKEIKEKRRDTTEDEEVVLSRYLLNALLPFLKQINEQQQNERAIDAKIQVSETEVQQTVSLIKERLYCNNCKMAIFDYHRNCRNCKYDMCLTCCREIRHGSIQKRGSGTVKQYPNIGSSTKDISPVTSSRDSQCESSFDEGVSIPCPRKKSSGRSCDLLELRCVFPPDFLTDLEKKAEEINKNYEVDKSKSSATCPCFESGGEVAVGKKKLLKASDRKKSNDNFLYYATASEIQHEGIHHFQKHWITGSDWDRSVLSRLF